MWLRLGNDELLNLEHCTSIKKIDPLVIELRYADPDQNREIHFEGEESCDLAFEHVIKNLVRMHKAME